MSASFLRLHPIDGFKRCSNGVEFLRAGCTERPSIDCFLPSPDGTQECMISLGKNSRTMIADPTLPRVAAHVIVERAYADSQAASVPPPAAPIVHPPTAPSASLYSSLDQQLKRKSPPHLMKLRLRLPKYDKGFVMINHQMVRTDSPTVNEGDILSLQSLSYSYDYVVLIHPISDANIDNVLPTSIFDEAVTTISPPQSQLHVPEFTDDIPKDSVAASCSRSNDILLRIAQDEFTCAICLEYQVQSTMLVPCGHSFCRSCIWNPKSSKIKLKSCSVCNSHICTIVPNRTIDNCLHALTQTDSSSSLSEQSLLPTEDVCYFKERVAATSVANVDRKCHLATHHRLAKRQRPASSRASNHSRRFNYNELASFPHEMIPPNQALLGVVQRVATPSLPHTAPAGGNVSQDQRHGATPTDAIVID